MEEALNVLKIVSFKHAQEAISNQNDAIARPPLVPLLKVKETPLVLNSRGCVFLFAGLIYIAWRIGKVGRESIEGASSSREN